jgi:4-aminobutyrate aminotransferase-like enzyme
MSFVHVVLDGRVITLLKAVYQLLNAENNLMAAFDGVELIDFLAGIATGNDVTGENMHK